mgnify:CR=1 FL=1
MADIEKLLKEIQTEQKRIDKEILKGNKADLSRLHWLEKKLEYEKLTNTDLIFQPELFRNNLIAKINTPGIFDIKAYAGHLAENITEPLADRKLEIVSDVIEHIEQEEALLNRKGELIETIAQLERGQK